MSLVDDATDAETKEPWERYVGGIRAFAAVITGRAGRGVGRDTLAAAITGHIISALMLNTAVLAMFASTRRAAVGSLVLLVIAAWTNRYGLLCLIRAPKQGTGAAYSITTWNVMHTNEPEQVASAVAECGSDLVVLFEPVTAHLDAVELSGHMVRLEVPGDGDERHAGVAAYGNELVREITWHDLDGMGALRCVLAREHRDDLVVWGFRPEAPTDADRQVRWHRQMLALRKAVAAEEHPYIVVGDLNSCIWHEPLWRVCRDGGLRRGSSLRGGTWCHPVVGWRGRIDHILAGTGVAVRSMRRGRAHGSDHRMLSAVVQRSGK